MYIPKNASDIIPKMEPLSNPTLTSLTNSVSFCFPVSCSSINTLIVTARDWVPTFPAISSTRDWKHITIGKTATTDSNIPTTDDTAIPKNNNIISHGSLFLLLSITGSFKSSSAVRPPNLA